jgi:hypothetical protein
MKDQVTTLMEAVRQAQAVLANYVEPGPRNAEKTVSALLDILDDKEVVRAMRLLYPDASPTLVPDEEKEDRRCHGSNMLWRAENDACMTARSILKSRVFWDGEFDVRLGDAINGIVAHQVRSHLFSNSIPGQCRTPAGLTIC